MLQMRVDLILTLSKRFFWLFSFLREKERVAPIRKGEASGGFQRGALRTRGGEARHPARAAHERAVGRAVGWAAAFAGCVCCCVLVALFLEFFPELQQSPQFPGPAKQGTGLECGGLFSRFTELPPHLWHAALDRP